MQRSRRPSVESFLVGAALATIAGVGGWAAGAWDPPAQQLAETTTPAPNYGPAPESDARAGVPDVCSRRVGCLLR